MADQPVDKDTGQPLDTYPAPPPSKTPLPRSDDDSADVDTFVNRFQTKTDALGHELAGIERQRGAVEQKNFSDIDKKLAADRAQMQKAFNAESAGPDSLPPAWNADKERAARIRTPIEDFGSIGSIFGIIASAFTKKPMVSALTASAAAMNAIRNHDEEGYKSAYQAWKDNTALALKRFNMEHELTEDANKFLDTDMATWKVKQLQIAAQFDNQKAIAMLEAGMAPELLQAQASQLNARDKIQDIMERQETYDIRRTVFSNEVKAWDKEHPDANPYQRAKARLEILTDITQGGKNLVEDLLRKYRLENPAATAEDEAKFLQEHQIGGRGISGGSGSQLTKMQGELAERIAKQQETGIADPVIPMLEKAIKEASQAKAQPKNFTSIEQSELKIAPDLMKHLETLDAFSSATGTVSGLVQRFGAEYGGVNDPAIIWQAALDNAKAAVAQLPAGSRMTKAAIETALDQLPKDYQSARFGKYKVQQLMADVRNQAQTALSVLEAEGKPIPRDVLDKFEAMGVYPQSEANKDPLIQLRKDPAGLSDEALIDLSHYMSALPQVDQERIVNEAKRRRASETLH